MKYFLIGIIVFLLLVCFITFYRIRILMEKNELLIKEQSLREQDYNQQLILNNNLKHVKHDVEKYKRILSYVSQKENIIYAVIEDTEKKCDAANVSFEHVVDLAGVPEWLTKDIVSTVQLLGNLLENALEAQEGLEEGWIYLSMSLDETRNMYHIEVKNAKTRNLNVVDNHMQTTKKNHEEHGFGTKIIDEVILKYKGQIKREDYGEFFWVLVDFFVDDIREQEIQK